MTLVPVTGAIYHNGLENPTERWSFELGLNLSQDKLLYTIFKCLKKVMECYWIVHLKVDDLDNVNSRILFYFKMFSKLFRKLVWVCWVVMAIQETAVSVIKAQSTKNGNHFMMCLVRNTHNSLTLQGWFWWPFRKTFTEIVLTNGQTFLRMP